METEKKEEDENTEMIDVESNGDHEHNGLPSAENGHKGEKEEQEKEQEEEEEEKEHKIDEEEDEEDDRRSRKIFADDDEDNSDEEFGRGNFMPPPPSGGLFGSTFSFLYPSSMMMGSPYGMKREKDIPLPVKEKRSAKDMQLAASIAERAKYIPVRLTLKVLLFDLLNFQANSNQIGTETITLARSGFIRFRIH